jgi:hypothetical protein
MGRLKPYLLKVMSKPYRHLSERDPGNLTMKRFRGDDKAHIYYEARVNDDTSNPSATQPNIHQQMTAVCHMQGTEKLTRPMKLKMRWRVAKIAEVLHHMFAANSSGRHVGGWSSFYFPGCRYGRRA